MGSERVVLSCEHATARVPGRYADLFRTARARAALEGHRGHDFGARSVALGIAKALRVPLHEFGVTRLLVDGNRSLHHRRLFSEFSRPLPVGERERLLRDHYHPYRDGVETQVARAIRRGGRVLHVSVHSFAERLGGESRRAEAGLLYDPSRVEEATLAAAWRGDLRVRQPRWRVRRNYPDRGVSDGLGTPLRGRFAPESYLGIELELNRAMLRTVRRTLPRLGRLLAESLEAARSVR